MPPDAPDPPDPPDEDFAETLRALREHYAGELPDRLAAIDAALAADPIRARPLVHRLRGSAGSYGFAAVSEAAALLEDALDAEPADPAAIARAHAALRAACAAV